MSGRLNTQDLIDLLINRHGLERKEAENFIKEFFSLIEEGLEKDKSVKIKGLGTFKLVDVESRESVNVNTGERIEIQGHTKISFTPDTALREIINKPFAHFETVVLNDDIDFNEIAEDNTESSDTTLPEELTEDIEVTPQPSTPEKQIEKESSGNKVLTLVVVLTILLCGILLFFTYYSDIFPEKKKQPAIPAPPVTENNAVTDSLTADSIEKVATIPVSEKPKAEKPAPTTGNMNRSNVIPFSKIPVNPDSTNYEIIGTKTTHTIKEGETLIRISYRYYGTKDLYPYLITHNRSVIKNSNLVPIGTTIRIPELKKK